MITFRRELGALALALGIAVLFADRYIGGPSPDPVPSHALYYTVYVLWSVLSVGNKVGMIFDQRRIGLNSMAFYAFLATLYFLIEAVNADTSPAPASLPLMSWLVTGTVFVFFLVDILDWFIVLITNRRKPEPVPVKTE